MFVTVLLRLDLDLVLRAWPWLRVGTEEALRPRGVHPDLPVRSPPPARARRPPVAGDGRRRAEPEPELQLETPPAPRHARGGRRRWGSGGRVEVLVARGEVGEAAGRVADVDDGGPPARQWEHERVVRAAVVRGREQEPRRGVGGGASGTG